MQNIFLPQLSKRKSSILFSMLIICLSYTQNTKAQSQEKLYSLMMLNFAKGIQWPETDTGNRFIIGILEYPPLVSELSSAAVSTKIGEKKIEVREFTNAEDILRCHILFVPAYKAKLLPYILNKLSTAPTLIVTNKMDLAKKGSGVNFILANGKLQYEINCSSIERRGMRISSRLKGMGIIVDDK